MFGIGGFELFLILLFGFLIFGPDKLPVMAKTLGKAIGKFRSAQEEMNKVIKTEVFDPNSDEPFKNPLDVLAKAGEGDKKDKDDKQESFSERKARYDKERAARKATEAEKADA
ncbi:MAG: twin-arginine translocase TatA/TatE family subunit, partial [Gordonibacter sp.]